MSGTDIAYQVDVKEGIEGSVLRVLFSPLRSYAFAARYPVLTEAMLLSGSTRGRRGYYHEA
eukprot:2766543-Rhodomonas_salina.2